MAGQKTYLGIDIGGTKIAAGLVSGSSINKYKVVPTQAKQGKKRVLKNLAGLINQYDLKKVTAIGLGIPGQINGKRGVVVSSPNFSKDFHNVALQKYLHSKFRKPIRIDNDASCFTLAEAIYGSGKGAESIIGFTLGTGIGGGIVINKKIFGGHDGFAGELGHTTVVQSGNRCSCKQHGHVEAYASGRSIEKTFFQLTAKRLTALEIEHLAHRGNPNAKTAYQIARIALANGLANAINTFNPDIIVLGGGMAKVKDLLTGPAIALTKKLVVFPQLANTKIVISKLKGAAILGAALLVKE